jgi:hypothetical protein
MSNVYRLHAIVIGCYTLLALVLTWPLAAQLTSHIPGEATWAFDESTFVWNMWWLKFSLLSRGQSPLFSDYTFFPLGIDLTTYTFNLFNAAFSLPLQMILSLPLTNNLILLFSYIASAYGTFLLLLYLLSHDGPPPRPAPLYLAAFAAGCVFAFSASRMMYVALGHYNFVTIQWFPFYTLFLLKTLRQGGFKNMLSAALFAALCLYVELTFSLFLLFLTLIIFSEGYLCQSPRPTWPATGRWLGRFAAVAAIAGLSLIFTAPFSLAVLPHFLDPAFAEPGWGEGLKLSADLAGLVSLTPLHPLAGVEWVSELKHVVEGTSRFKDANTLFLGYGILACALLGYLSRPKAGRVWLWSGLIFTVLSLGPLLTINGRNRFNLDGLEVTFPLPFALLHYLPLINANRVPNRFGIPLTLALAVLAGYGLAWLLPKLNRVSSRPGSTVVYFFLAGLGLLGLMFDQYSVPLSLTDARIPPLYDQIGAEAEPFTLLQLPLGWRNSYGMLGAERTQLQYYQTAHHRPILGGNTSRNPAFKFEYYRQIPLFQALTETELLRDVEPERLAQAAGQAAELMTLYNIKYLVIHEPIPRREPYLFSAAATRKLALELIPHQPGPVYESPGVQAFQVDRAPIPEPLLIDLGTWAAAPYRGEGWAADETIFAATANWATAREATLFFPVQGAAERFLSLTIAPFTYPNSPPQRLQLSLNGTRLVVDHSLHEGWQTVSSRLPAELLRPGLNRLQLHFSDTAQPRQVLPFSRAIGRTGLISPVDLELNSGPDFAFMTSGFAGQAEDASAHRRGINLAILDPESGRLLEKRGFDTAANGYEAIALAEFIATLPAGQLVLLASQGPEATAFFTAETWQALQQLGLAPAPVTPPLAAIGVKGAEPGTALQVTGQAGTTAYLRLGAAPDTRPLAAAVDQFTIGRVAP